MVPEIWMEGRLLQFLPLFLPTIIIALLTVATCRLLQSLPFYLCPTNCLMLNASALIQTYPGHNTLLIVWPSAPVV